MSAGDEYAQRDRQLALAFGRAAHDARVGRIIYLGGLGETGSHLSKHLASRRDVEGALASAGVPVTVLRAAMIIGSGSASFEILRYLVHRLAEGLRNPVVCRDDRITRLVPQKLLNVREAIRAALSQVTARQVETNWSMAGPMPGDPDWSGGTVFRDTREVAIDAPAGAVFRAVCRLGGQRGWHGANWLWIIRGWLDRLAGGPGLRRGRRDPEALSYGEALDFWRVGG